MKNHVLKTTDRTVESKAGLLDTELYIIIRTSKRNWRFTVFSLTSTAEPHPLEIGLHTVGRRH